MINISAASLSHNQDFTGTCGPVHLLSEWLQLQVGVWKGARLATVLAFEGVADSELLGQHLPKFSS